MPKKILTQKQLKEALHYNPDTGLFIWIRPTKRVKMGDIAGYIDKRGCRFIGINFELYRAHRLAWLYSYGEFPSGGIDHANRNPSDNRLINLRIATHSQNKRNTVKYSNNKSGYKGVYWVNKRKKWQAQISIEGRTTYIGRFENKEDAYAAYCEKAKELHGEFINI